MQSIAAATIVLAAALFPAGCNTVKPVAQANTTSILDQVRQNNSISVSLCGLMTITDHGQNITTFKEFAVQNVPLTWVDTTFLGNTTSYPAPHKQIIDHVHGIATSDGRFLEHVSFWQEIKEDGMPDIIFDITVYAIPMDGTGNSTLATTFVQTGDVRKYVLGIDYIQDGVQYCGTDWRNAEQPPVLSIQFAK